MARSTLRPHPWAYPILLHIGNVHGLLYCPDSKYPTCVRDRVYFLPTECASVRCHNYNADGRHPSHVDSYQQSVLDRLKQ